MACSLPDLIQFVAVGLDMPSMAQASSNVMLYVSIGYLQALKKPLGCGYLSWMWGIFPAAISS